MRSYHSVLIMLAGFLLLPILSWSQGPGGSSRSVNSDDIFYRLSGGEEVIVVSAMAPELKERFQRMAAQLGLAGDRIMAYRKSSATQHRKYRPWRRSRSSLMFSNFSSVSL